MLMTPKIYISSSQLSPKLHIFIQLLQHLFLHVQQISQSSLKLGHWSPLHQTSQSSSSQWGMAMHSSKYSGQKPQGHSLLPPTYNPFPNPSVNVSSIYKAFSYSNHFYYSCLSHHALSSGLMCPITSFPAFTLVPLQSIINRVARVVPLKT